MMKKLCLTLPGSIRSKKNSKQPAPIPSKHRTTLFKRYAKKGMLPVRIILVPSKAYQKWEKEARQAIIPQISGAFGVGMPPLTCSINVEAHFYYKGQQPDLSGCCESVGDCLEGYVWENDKKIVSWDGSRLHHDLKNPRTELIVRWQ